MCVSRRVWLQVCTVVCKEVCASPRKTHIPATRPLLLLTAREKSSIKEIEANSRQTINKSQSGTFPLWRRKLVAGNRDLVMRSSFDSPPRNSQFSILATSQFLIT